jgi:hypothetical protein
MLTFEHKFIIFYPESETKMQPLAALRMPVKKNRIIKSSLGT